MTCQSKRSIWLVLLTKHWKKLKPKALAYATQYPNIGGHMAEVTVRLDVVSAEEAIFSGRC